MHLGNIWTALLAWLQVRSSGGTMVLRIEDLDPDRCRAEYTTQLIQDLAWLGLDWDEGPDVGGPFGSYRQDERRDMYQAALAKLIEQGLVYPCYCTRAELKQAASAPHGTEGEHIYPGTCRNLTPTEEHFMVYQGRRPALRLQVPSAAIGFTDGLYGRIITKMSEACGDFVLQRADGVHAYQLAVVVDDAAMQITDVLRGDDLLTSTPRQLLLYKLLGLRPPRFVHVPLLYGTDGHRLSKRQQDLSLACLRQRGCDAVHIIGYLAWKAGLIPKWTDVEPRQLVDSFSIDRLSTAPVVVDDDIWR
jgi:glutamyl-tRNA synthetase